MQVWQLFFTIYLLPYERDSIDRRKRRPSCKTTEVLKDEEFRLCFRIGRKDFKKLVNLLSPKIARNSYIANLRNGVAEPEVRVTVVLCVLGLGSVLDWILIWHFTKSTLFQFYAFTFEDIT